MNLPNLLEKDSSLYLYLEGDCTRIADRSDEEEGERLALELDANGWVVSVPQGDDLPLFGYNDSHSIELEFWRNKTMPSDDTIVSFFWNLIRHYGITRFAAELKIIGPMDSWELILAWYRYDVRFPKHISRTWMSDSEIDVFRDTCPKTVWDMICYGMLMTRTPGKADPGGYTYINNKNQEVEEV